MKKRDQRVTRNERAALQHAAVEAVRFTTQLVSLAETIPACDVETSLRTIEWLGSRAAALVERPEPRPPVVKPRPATGRERRAALTAALDLGGSMPRAVTKRKGQTAA